MEVSETTDDVLEIVDVLASDFIARYRAGDRPTVEEYANRHPDLSEPIRRVFPLVLSVEKVKLDQQSESDGSATLAGRLLERLGDFRLVREIGRGGMGIVYEAEQESLGRTVAIKVLPKQCLLDDDALARFTREAKTAASMHHSNIVPIFGTGQTDDGTHYLVMQLVRGESLDQRISESESGFSATEAATIARQIADALAYAHAGGVLHRDVKPANILIDEDGNAQITDFGLARRTQDDPTETRTLSGSLRYMAPERFQGIADQRSDVYGLGLALYEMLTGEPAFAERDPNHLMAAISKHTLSPLDKKRPDLPVDLTTIVGKAVHAEPALRYPSAEALRDDLDRFLSDRPILARRTSMFSRLWRWSRRNPKLASATFIAATAMLVASVASTAAFVLTSKAKRETAAALSQSEETVNVALRSLDQTIEKLATPATSIDDVGMEGIGPSAFALEPSPRMASVLESIQPLYERLAGQSPSRPDVLIQVTDASVRLSQIHRQLGRTDAAAATLKESIARLDERLGQVEIPPNISNRLYAQLHSELGRVYLIELKDQEAERAFKKAVEFAARLPESDVPGQLILATAHTALGTPPPQGRTDLPDRQEILRRTDHLDTASAILARLDDDNQSLQDVRILRARVWLAKARLSERPPARRQYTNRAIELLSDELERTPDEVAVRFALVEALASTNLRRLPRSSRLEQEAKDHLTRAIDELNPLRNRFPETQVFAVAEVHLWHKLSALSRFEQDFEAAYTQLQRAIEVQSNLVDAWPDSFPHRCWRALLYRSLAEMRREQDDDDAARQAIANAIADVDAIEPDSARHPFVIRTERIVAALQEKLNE